MKLAATIAAVLSYAALSCAASAATVTSVQGNVSINRGAGYAPVNSGTGAASGDKVMAAKNSVGQIAYDNGCVVEVLAGQVVTVLADPPCATGASFLGGGIGPVIIGAVVVGGAVAAIAASGNDSDDDAPASP